MNKHGYLDKYDAHIPNQNQFVHDEYGIAERVWNFHTPNAWAFYGPRRRGFPFGVAKKSHKASGMGITVDGSYIGKSDM